VCVPVLLSIALQAISSSFLLGMDGQLEIQQAGMLSHGLCYGLLGFSGYIAWAWALGP
jgi:hypothetical protein